MGVQEIEGGIEKFQEQQYHDKGEGENAESETGETSYRGL